MATAFKQVIIVHGRSKSGKTTWIQSRGLPMLDTMCCCDSNVGLLRHLELMYSEMQHAGFDQQKPICIETLEPMHDGMSWIDILEPAGWCVSFRCFGD